jgi:hypothetical protein
MMSVVVIHVCVLSLLLVLPVQAARTVSQDQPVHVRLELLHITAVVFPEPVASVPMGIDEHQMSIEKDGHYVFLMAKDPTLQNRCFVVGQSGKLYLIHFKVTTPGDDMVYLIAPSPTAPTQSSQGPPLSLSAMLRALRTGTGLPGQTGTDVPAPTLTDPRLTITTSQAVTWGSMLGLMVTVQNTSPIALTMDLRWGMQPPSIDSSTSVNTWTFAPRLTIKAVAADDELLSPGGQTRVYFLLERRP